MHIVPPALGPACLVRARTKHIGSPKASPDLRTKQLVQLYVSDDAPVSVGLNANQLRSRSWSCANAPYYRGKIACALRWAGGNRCWNDS